MALLCGWRHECRANPYIPVRQSCWTRRTGRSGWERQRETARPCSARRQMTYWSFGPSAGPSITSETTAPSCWIGWTILMHRPRAVRLPGRTQPNRLGRLAAKVVESIRICRVFTLRRLEPPRFHCRWRAPDTSARTMAGACRRVSGFEFVAASAHGAWSAASADVWRSAC